MMQSRKKMFSLKEVTDLTGVTEPVIYLYVERQWISPVTPDALDEEDVARLSLIRDLEDLGVNREAVPLVLHLLDQLYYLRARLKQLGVD
jgi:chaperone modulatory protein CbpM